MRVLVCLWDLQLHLYQLIIVTVAKTTSRVLIVKFDEEGLNIKMFCPQL